MRRQVGYTLIELLMVATFSVSLIALGSYYYHTTARLYPRHRQQTASLEQQKMALAYFRRDVAGSQAVLSQFGPAVGGQRTLILRKPGARVVVFAFEPQRQLYRLVRLVFDGSGQVAREELVAGLQSGYFLQSGNRVTLEMQASQRLPSYATVGFRLP